MGGIKKCKKLILSHNMSKNCSFKPLRAFAERHKSLKNMVHACISASDGNHFLALMPITLSSRRSGSSLLRVHECQCADSAVYACDLLYGEDKAVLDLAHAAAFRIALHIAEYLAKDR